MHLRKGGDWATARRTRRSPPRSGEHFDRREADNFSKPARPRSKGLSWTRRDCQENGGLLACLPPRSSWMHFHVITGSPRAPMRTRAQLLLRSKDVCPSSLPDPLYLFLSFRSYLQLLLTSDFIRLSFVFLFFSYSCRLHMNSAPLCFGCTSLLSLPLPFIGLIIFQSLRGKKILLIFKNLVIIATDLKIIFLNH